MMDRKDWKFEVGTLVRNKTTGLIAEVTSHVWDGVSALYTLKFEGISQEVNKQWFFARDVEYFYERISKEFTCVKK